MTNDDIGKNRKTMFNVEIQCNRTVAEMQRISVDVQMDIAHDLLGRVTDTLSDLGFDAVALADATEVLAVEYRDAARVRRAFPAHRKRWKPLR